MGKYSGLQPPITAWSGHGLDRGPTTSGRDLAQQLARVAVDGAEHGLDLVQCGGHHGQAVAPAFVEGPFDPIEHGIARIGNLQPLGA